MDGFWRAWVRSLGPALAAVVCVACAASRARDEDPSSVHDASEADPRGPVSSPSPERTVDAGGPERGPCPADDELIRERFAASRVPDGQRCESETQTRTCEAGQLSPWSGTFEFATCRVDEPDRPPLERPQLRSGCDDGAGPREPLPEETCYAFRIQDLPEAGPEGMRIGPGEAYHDLYFAVPWPAGSVATRIDNFAATPATYWQATFASRASRAPGEIERYALGDASNARVLDMAHVGACAREMPADVGLALPDDGLIMLQWHYYNRSGGELFEHGGVRICTVPSSARAHVADLTVLGTENLGGPGLGLEPGENAFSGLCRFRGQAGVGADGGEAIHLALLNPQMRSMGVGIRLDLEREDGQAATLVDAPFDPERPAAMALMPPVALVPGDQLRTTCRYNNTSGTATSMGISVITEMCYLLALSYPAGRLSATDTPSLLRVDGVCM